MDLIKEVAIGLAGALLLFGFYLGLDMTPVLILGVMAGALFFLAGKKGLLAGGGIGPYHPETSLSFDEIGGQNASKRELIEALEFIVRGEEIRRLGIRPLKGILLYGPPGTGKTLLAKAAATYTNSAFVAASGSEFIEMYAGVGAQRVRQLFKSARDKARKEKKSGAVIFIDEIDVLGAKRGSNVSHMEYDQTLNQLLVEMDGIKGDEEVRVLIIAATNRPDLLDPALLRPGRFDRQVNVDLPEREGRLHILNLHTRNKPLADDVDLEEIARETVGFSGAQLESLTNEAAILAMRDGVAAITHRHLKESVDKVLLGEQGDRRPSKEELLRVAFHEAGHALISEKVRRGSVARVTVTPRGRSLGYVRQSPADDACLYTKSYLLNQIAVALGGFVAEELVFGEGSTGAAQDFAQATQLAKKLIEGGMSELGVVSLEDVPGEMLHREIQRIIGEQKEEVLSFLTERRQELGRVADALFHEESLSGEELRRLLA